MATKATQQFISGATTITIQAPDAGSLKSREVPTQNTAESASGGVFVDDKAVTRYFVSFNVTLTPAQAVALEGFYRSTVQGRLTSFTWLDHRNRSWGGVRFDMPSLEYTRTAGDRYQYAIQLRASAAFGV